jgi:hypothetical protein
MRAKVLFVLCLFMLPTALQSASSGYHITKKVKIGGEGFWDYLNVDSDARRLYISRGTHVMVLDGDSLEPVGDIPNTQEFTASLWLGS